MHDLEQAHAFYHGLLELPIYHYEKGKHIFFKAGQSMLLCFNPEDSRLKTSPPGHYAAGPYHFAFEVKQHEYALMKARVKSKGITIDQEVRWKNNLESFYFKDPAGNILEIVPEGIWD